MQIQIKFLPLLRLAIALMAGASAGLGGWDKGRLRKMTAKLA